MKSEAAPQRAETAAKRVPFKKNILGEKDGETLLLGTHCRKCGRYSFPFRDICVFCHSRETDKKNLSPRGKLHTYTICRVPVPNTTPPYAVGFIDLPEGLMIFSQLAQWSEKGLKIGMDVELVVDKLRTDKEGNEIYSYKFRPAK